MFYQVKYSLNLIRVFCRIEVSGITDLKSDHIKFKVIPKSEWKNIVEKKLIKYVCKFYDRKF